MWELPSGQRVELKRRPAAGGSGSPALTSRRAGSPAKRRAELDDPLLRAAAQAAAEANPNPTPNPNPNANPNPNPNRDPSPNPNQAARPSPLHVSAALCLVQLAGEAACVEALVEQAFPSCPLP